VKAITVLELAVFRGAKESETGGFTMGEFDRVRLPMLGGCSVCGASIAAYNAAPSRSGVLKCAEGCIDADGFETVQEANIAIFPEEYEWKGIG
jgi:hypothetical protein